MPGTSRILLAAVAALASFNLHAAAAAEPRKTLTAFASERALQAQLERWAEQVRRRDEARRAQAGAAAEMAAPASAPLAAAKSTADAAESITNTQHAGVDEGGIVKVHGEHLVVLRRGRLFTVRIDDLEPVSSADAFGPDVDPRGAWYDELLVSGDHVVVIGYSYARGGTEIGLFRISRHGELAYRATYHLRSNDYYSSRNYASRLIGSRLVFYTPLYLDLHRHDLLGQLPAMRRWRAERPERFRRIAPATRIYRADEDLDPAAGVALHTVTSCDLAARELACESTAVLGPAGRVFYVSPGSVFVWTTSWQREARPDRPRSSVFRIPLDGAAPSALRAAGSPIDQFSFLEDAEGTLNVLVRSQGGGEAMWSAETNAGELALLRVPLASFSDGHDAAPASAYRRLPRPHGPALMNRFIGHWLLYGAGAGWRRPQPGTDALAFAVPYAADSGTFALPLEHSVERIEALGAHAVLVGARGRDLHFTTVRLGRHAALAGRYVRAGAAQAETRSHGFFYKPESGEAGLLGLPVVGGGEPGHRQLKRSAAAVLFLRNAGLELEEIGALEARGAAAADGCRASCVDWYGNSRPIFLRNRVIALMGYELVEGAVLGGTLVEQRRASFAPGAARLSAR